VIDASKFAIESSELAIIRDQALEIPPSRDGVAQRAGELADRTTPQTGRRAAE